MIFQQCKKDKQEKITQSDTCWLISALDQTFSFPYSLYETDGKTDVLMIINGILGALVGVTAGCAVVTPVEAVPIGKLKI